jgi:predicted XRE-type DNA-binding protein
MAAYRESGGDSGGRKNDLPGKLTPMAIARNKSSDVSHGNVLDDLGFPFHQAAVVKFKAELYQALLRQARKYSQKQLQVLLAEPQPRISELLNGKNANKSVDKLLNYAAHLGIEAKAKFPQTNRHLIQQELASAGR